MSKDAKKATPKSISALTARTQLGQILRRASQRDERFVVGRRGEPTAVIMGIKDFIKTIAPPPEYLQAMWQAARRKQGHNLSMGEIDAEIRASRQERRSSSEP